MRNNIFPIGFFISILCLAVSCRQSEERKLQQSIQISPQDILATQVITPEQQALLTPQEVLLSLKAGNEDFINDNLTVRNNTQRVREASLGQYPKAVILSCLDSRVPVEDIFHCGIGDVFVARVAGNIVDEDMLASMEYACKVSGSKLIMVLGHGHCGAIKSAIDDVKFGNITTLLFKIKPAVMTTNETYNGEKKSSNYDYTDAVCLSNVQLGLDNIRKYSPTLKEMEDNGEIMIIGGFYEMATGRVRFME